MNIYVGSKIIKAQAMTRLEYNDLRGWELPDDEDGSDDGYLVEYLDGGEPNHEDYAGYISWSPKEVFDNAYKQVVIDYMPEAHVLRIAAEHTELNAKVTALNTFVLSERFNSLVPEEKSLLKLQLRQMKPYLSTLTQLLKFYSVLPDDIELSDEEQLDLTLEGQDNE